MNTIKLIKAKEGHGWYLNIEDVISDAPLTALELLILKKILEDNELRLLEDLE